MHFSLRFLCVMLTLSLSAIAAAAQEVHSPDGQLLMNFSIAAGGVPSYRLTYKNKIVIKPSNLGLELKLKPNEEAH